MFTLLMFSLMASSFAADVDIRRAQLLDLAHELDGYPAGDPSRRLVQREETEAAFSEERKVEVVENTLKLEAELAATTTWSLERVRHALEVVLDGDQLVEQALSGKLNRHGVNGYSQIFRAAAVEGLRKDRVGLWLRLNREARQFDGRQAVLRATKTIDLKTLGDVRYLGFLDPRWHLNLVASDELRDFAKFHVRKIVELEVARVQIEKLHPSDLRRKTLDGASTVLDLLRRQLHDLPEILGVMGEERLTNRKFQQRQPRPVAAWVRLGEEPAPSPDGETWARQLEAIARELHVDPIVLRPNCRTNLIN